jgi:hypothetical protein
MYIISTSKAVMIDVSPGRTDSTIMVIEK